MEGFHVEKTYSNPRNIHLVSFVLCFGAVMGSLVLVNIPLLASIEEPALWILLGASIIGVGCFAFN